jgi:signal transduction histidine kinase
VNDGAGSGAGTRFSDAIIIRCDAHGHVLWMSEGAHAALGSSQNLPHALAAEPLAGRPLAFAGVLEKSGDLWIAARLTGSEPERRPPLEPVEHRLLRHYFRLASLERRLAARTRKRRGGGLSAVQQIERERQRLGRELHTGVGQMLAAIRLQADVLDSQLPAGAAAARQTMDRISRLAADALEQVRALSRRLHPPNWQRLSLEDAIRELWELSGIPQKFEAALRLTALPRQPGPELTTAVYRIAQEALSNIAQHSGATRVEASLEEKDGRLLLIIADNGVGFDPDALIAGPARAGLGLRAARELAAAVGADLRIASGPHGSRVELSAPLIT